MYGAGRIEKHGNWFTLRYWLPTDSDGMRRHARARICPTNPRDPAYLPVGARRQRAHEILTEVSKKTVTVQQTANGPTFEQQWLTFIHDAEHRAREPVKPKTATTWRSCANKWLIPELGRMPLALVDNATVKPLIAKMRAAGLGAKSQVNALALVKLLVASLVDDQGNQVHPRSWNHQFLDLPIVKRQRRPQFSEQDVTNILKSSAEPYRTLYMVLAASGLRIGEALALKRNDVGGKGRHLLIAKSIWNGKLQQPKTEAARRIVDLCEPVAERFWRYLEANHIRGFIFPSGTGQPLQDNNILRRHLHPLLRSLKISQAGFHGFRRHRITWLRKQHVVEDLIRHWAGHSPRNVTDRYADVTIDLDFRLQNVDAAGVGFELPAQDVPNVPKKRRSKSAGKRKQVSD